MSIPPVKASPSEHHYHEFAVRSPMPIVSLLAYHFSVELNPLRTLYDLGECFGKAFERLSVLKTRSFGSVDDYGVWHNMIIRKSHLGGEWCPNSVPDLYYAVCRHVGEL